MAEGKKSFIVYTNWEAWIEDLSDEQTGQLFKWMLAYVNDKNPEYPSDQTVKLSCKMVRGQLKEDLNKYKSKVESVNNARAYRKQTNNICIENVTSKINNEINIENNNETNNDINNDFISDIDNVIVNDIVNDNDNDINIDIGQNELNKDYRMILFERFWSAYPKKINKANCIKWFTSKSHKVDDELVDKMVNAIETLKKSNQWKDTTYIPYPSTWLNGRRWEDQEENTSSTSVQEKIEEEAL